MKISLLQSQIGRFNIIGRDESFSFSLCLRDNDKIVEREGVRAILYYSGEPEDKREFDDYMEDLDVGEIFKKSFQYAKSVISSCDYMAQLMLFAKLYKENHEQIKLNWQTENDKQLLKEIDRLESQVGKIPFGLEKEHFIDSFKEIAEEEINKFGKWIKTNLEKLEELKPESPTAIALNEENQKFQSKQNVWIALIPKP